MLRFLIGWGLCHTIASLHHRWHWMVSLSESPRPGPGHGPVSDRTSCYTSTQCHDENQLTMPPTQAPETCFSAGQGPGSAAAAATRVPRAAPACQCCRESSTRRHLHLPPGPDSPTQARIDGGGAGFGTETRSPAGTREGGGRTARRREQRARARAAR
jgi:hypothetical protein